jgi:hypothetical protein
MALFHRIVFSGTNLSNLTIGISSTFIRGLMLKTKPPIKGVDYLMRV